MSETVYGSISDRLVNLSDATVAIAVTLLVLPLADLAGRADNGGLETFLIDHTSMIGAFVTSFLIIAVIWTEHHRLFELLVSYDGPLLALNFVWLFAIVVITFAPASGSVRASCSQRSAPLPSCWR